MKKALLILALLVVAIVPSFASEAQGSPADWQANVSKASCQQVGGQSFLEPTSAKLYCYVPLAAPVGGGGCWCCAKIGDPVCCANCFDQTFLNVSVK